MTSHHGLDRTMRVIPFFLMTTLALACGAPALAQDPSAAAPPAAVATAEPAVVSDPDYRLGPGDRIRITVYGEDNLTGEFLVSGGGVISFPLIGDVPATGHTVADVQLAITKALADGYLHDPRVSAEVLTYRPFYILGEVNKPGEYPYTNGLTILNAVATAQGFTYRANEKLAFVKHLHAASEEKEPLNASTPVAPGDTIRIVERYF